MIEDNGDPENPASRAYCPERDYSQDEEAVGWLDTLINSYERVRRHDPDAREDPDAAHTMLLECRALAIRLRAGLPACETELCPLCDDPRCDVRIEPAVAVTPEDIPW